MDNTYCPPARSTVLATDLDGTLIPLSGESRNVEDLRALAGEIEEHNLTLVFVTGRHFQSVIDAMDQFQLPQPDWIICDVGTSMFERQASGEFVAMDAYQQDQDRIIASMPIRELREQLQTISGLRIQEPEKQGRFKLSFYADADQLPELVARVRQTMDRTAAPYSLIHSVDPFNGDGLIDLLPATVSKAHALAWWVTRMQMNPDAVVFSGDSGNDLAALTAGYKTIVVGNADRALAREVSDAHRKSGWNDRLYLAQGRATSGVLEGCRWFGLAASPGPTTERLGATFLGDKKIHFRVWAPNCEQVSVETLDTHPPRRHKMVRGEDGYFSSTVSILDRNTRYMYLLDNQNTRPDPASRYQPDGVHGASRVMHSRDFPWTDRDWRGVSKRDLIIYELHIGTFTPGGTFQSAIERLPDIVELGVCAIEVMPVAQTPGRWNWGYDGVDLFAVRNTYGEPRDFMAFVDACHAAGIAVILDVVYNHVGPEGNYLAEFGPYFSHQHHTPWGEAFNYDERHSSHVRSFIVHNAISWLDEYHLDGLRLDAVHLMHDQSDFTMLDELRCAVSEYEAQVSRDIHLIAEANVYDADLLAEKENRRAYDAIWCDCLMYSIYSHALPDLRLTHREYRGAADLLAALGTGYVYEYSGGELSRDGTGQDALPTGDAINQMYLSSLVTALQTHDSVGNHPHGKRLHQLTSCAFQKAAAALTLLYPSIPLIFMGEECALDAPFPFFADFQDPQLREAVDQGRTREYPQHLWRDAIAPSDPRAFHTARLGEKQSCNHDVFAWYRALIALRRQGIAEGWLAPRHMTSSHDPESGIFTLCFHGDHTKVRIQSRLATVGQQPPEPAAVLFEGLLLLSSELDPATDGNQILLQPNHAVISRC